MRQQIQAMLALQNSMNTKVNADWQSQGFEWYRAIWIECGELLDHYGWKWWKRQDPDVEQVKLELIDIWHFGLSILLSRDLTEDEIVDLIEANLNVSSDEPDFRLDLERFAGETLTTRDFSVASFGRLMAGIDLSFDQLYEGYVGKNVLNFFRQDNGYKDGSYRKIWGGREDNEHLVEIIAELDAKAAGFPETLYERLNTLYQSLNA